MSGTPVKVKREAAQRFNLEVLQKQDPQIVEIAHTTSHSVVYEHVEGQWQRKNVAGALFIVRRAAEPLSSIIVLNREGMEHYGMPLTPETLVSAQPSMVMLREGEGGRTVGFWTGTPDAGQQLFGAIQGALTAAAAPAAGHLAPSLATLFSAAGAAAAGGAEPASRSAAAPSPAAPAGGSGGHPSPLVLTKRQLQAMLVRLVQNEQFADILHREYLATVQRQQQQQQQRQ